MRIVLGACIGLGAFSSVAQAAMAYHPPQSEAEKALDVVLHLSNHDQGLLPFVFSWPQHTAPQAERYRSLFTASLLKSIADKEAAIVNEQCDGHYKAGELCGMEYDPISCAQDFPDAYAYQTLSSTAHEATILTSPPEHTGEALARYRLVKTSAGWALDGIDCDEGNTFNMP